MSSSQLSVRLFLVERVGFWKASVDDVQKLSTKVSSDLI